MTAYKEAVVHFKELLPYTIMVKGTKFTHTLISTSVLIIHMFIHTHIEHNNANIEIALMKEMEDTI